MHIFLNNSEKNYITYMLEFIIDHVTYSMFELSSLNFLNKILYSNKEQLLIFPIWNDLKYAYLHWIKNHKSKTINCLSVTQIWYFQ